MLYIIQVKSCSWLFFMNLKVQKCHDLSISSKKSPPTVAQRHRANRVSMWRCHAATEEPNEKTRGGTLTFNDPLRMFCRWNFISLSGMVPQKIGIFLSSFLLFFSNLHYILKDFGELFNHHLVCQLHCLFGQSFDRVLGTIFRPWTAWTKPTQKQTYCKNKQIRPCRRV